MSKIIVNSSDPKVPDGFMLISCNSCGNTGLHKITANYRQELIDYCDGDPEYMGYTDWIILECPVCQSISLVKASLNDYAMNPNNPEYKIEKVVYPAVSRTLSNTPENIVKSYEAAIETLKVDLNVTLIAIRRVLEMICKERGCKKRL